MLRGVTLSMQSVVSLSVITLSRQSVAMPFAILLNVAAPALTVGPGTALLRKEIAILMICYAR
jgi:hypothetical protein